MKKKIAILGSTGSIGKQTLEIIKKDKKNFKVILLTADKNIKLLSKQINEFKVKNIIIKDTNNFEKLKKKYRNLNISNNFEDIDKLVPSKLDYTMSSISGFHGLRPTLNIIKKTKIIAIANKESIICGWSLIKKKLNKFKTKFIPIDSEHYSIWSIIKDIHPSKVDQIILTASGGPFFKKKKNLKKTRKAALNHPNWKMGAKISIDSATLMNKVFEVIEAKKIFNIDLKKFKILIHPRSYVHTIIKLKNGLIKIVAHDTDMKIPIFNSLYLDDTKILKTNKIDIKLLNNLNLTEVSYKKFPLVKLLKNIPSKDTLFETLLVSINDEIVGSFLKKKISFDQIPLQINKLLNSKYFAKLRYKKLNNLQQIEKLNDFVRLKTQS